MGGIVSAIMVFIVPKFKRMFRELSLELPPATRKLVEVADGEWSVWIFAVALIAACTVVALARSRPMRRTPKEKANFTQRIAYLVPFLHRTMRQMILAEFCRELAMLIRVGTPAPRALEVLAGGTLNPWFRDRVRKAAELCESGHDLADAFEKARVDHRVAWLSRNLRSPEALAEGLDQLARETSAGVSTFATVVTGLIPPFVVLCLAVVVGFIVIALFLPLIKLIGAMGG